MVTTYATMRRDAEQIAAHQPGWGLVVADEAQNVKNVRAGAARALRTIPGEAKLALTGTPVENNLAELWAIVDWTTPGLLGSYEHFRRGWSRPIESRRDSGRAGDLALLIRPFVLRRRKSDPGIAPELPPKTETDYRVHLTREQVGLYEAVVRETLAEIESASGMLRRGLVVKLLTQLKQICNHPAQFLRTPHERLGGRSGKLGLLDELVEEIVAEGGGILLFTQYAKMGHLLSRHLDEKHIGNQFLHGGTHIRTREAMVRRFQNGELPVFVLSLKAAGTGLNLTRADHVIHFDRWWNPAVEDQATDRAHRIGQTKPVQVHRLISEGTIEESIAELITSKRSLADAVVNAGEGALTELSDAELAAAGAATEVAGSAQGVDDVAGERVGGETLAIGGSAAHAHRHDALARQDGDHLASRTDGPERVLRCARANRSVSGCATRAAVESQVRTEHRSLVVDPPEQPVGGVELLRPAWWPP